MQRSAAQPSGVLEGSVAENWTVPEALPVGNLASLRVSGSAAWTTAYLRLVGVADACCGLLAGALAFEVRFGHSADGAAPYIWVGLAVPVLWLAALALAGAYDARFIGVGSDEFRRVLNAGICLTAAVAVVAYATKTDLARGYVVVALPSLTVLDLFTRYRLRKRLHKLRAAGGCMRKVVVVGHADVVGELRSVLRRETHHGLSVVAACILGPNRPDSFDGLPVIGGDQQCR